MSNVPQCPDHKTDMRVGDPEKGGGWFCPRRTSSGGFCKQRMTDAQWQAQRQTAPGPTASGGGDPASATVLADATVIAAALNMAGQVCAAHPDWFASKESVSAFAVESVIAIRMAL